MPNAKNIDQVRQIQDKLAKANAVILAEYRGLTVKELTELRHQLRAQQMEMRVYKNRLVKKALGDAAAGLDAYLSGPTAVTFSYGDPVAPAKVLATYAKAHKHLVLKGGLVEGAVADEARVAMLATLPSRDELLGQLVFVLNSPITGLVRVLNGPIRGLAAVVAQIKDKKNA